MDERLTFSCSHVYPKSSSPALSTEKHFKALAIVMAGGALRIVVSAWALHTFGTGWFFSRGTEMGLLGDALSHGLGFSSPFGPPTGPTAMVAPGYPLLVSLIFHLFGSFTPASALCLLLSNVVCNCVSLWLIYRVALHFASRRSALVVLVFSAFALPLIWMPTIFWETSISSLLLILMIRWATNPTYQKTWEAWAAGGVAVGLAGLLNPALLPSLSAILGLALVNTTKSHKRRWCFGIAFALAFLLTYAPWPIRNLRVFHSCVLTRTTVGLELWMGNAPGSTGYLEQADFPSYSRPEMREYKTLGEIAYMHRKQAVAVSVIRAEPVRFLLLSCKRLERFWFGSGTRSGSRLFVMHGTLTSALGLCGLCVLWSNRKQRRSSLYLAAPFLLFPLPYYFTHAEFRYRLVLDPLLAALSAVTIDALLGVLDSSNRPGSRPRWHCLKPPVLAKTNQ